MDFLILALLLGIKHSYDADHLVAVSNLLTRSRSLKQTTQMGASWASGHMITAIIVTAMLFVFRDSVLSFILGKFDVLVAIMLIFLGLVSLRQARMHMHRHKHGGLAHEHLHDKHLHRHMFGVGIVHGLASNDELLVLITATLGLNSFISIVAGLAVFSIGVVIGMIAFSLFLTYPLIRISRESLSRIVNIIAGSISLIYGALLLFGIV